MYSKQEKLAAARKKLKEFQGKQRENDSNRVKNAVSPANTNSSRRSSDEVASHYGSEARYSSPGVNPSPTSVNSYIPKPSEYSDCGKEEKLMYNTAVGGNFINILEPAIASISPNILPNVSPHVTLTDTSSISEFFNKDFNTDSNRQYQDSVNIAPINHPNSEFNSETNVKSDNSESNALKNELCTFFKDSDGVTGQEFNLNNVPVKSYVSQVGSDPKDFFRANTDASNVTNSTDIQNVEYLTTQISDLVDERNNLMQVLKRTEELLKYKTDQEQTLSQSVLMLQSRLRDLEGNVTNAENELHDLKAKNHQLTKQRDADIVELEHLQKKFDSKEEQFSELQRKLELKTKECESLSYQLREAQSQLSSSLIKIQQLTVGESNTITEAMSEMQNERGNLLQRIQDLEKSIEILNKEKELSSHNFHTYAQQCNGQLGSLSAEVRNLTKENQLLIEKNKILEKDLERQRKESEAAADQTELTRLTDKLNELTEQNRIFQLDLKEKIDEIEVLKKDRKEKGEEINQIQNVLQEIRSENLKLLQEKEVSNSNQKLLAAMESDKVAAARAVSQNQKLKDQLSELEEGFIKLSHEKLQLTDELAHEKHLKKELEHRLKEIESHHCHDGDHHHKPSDGTINESADVEELRNIIRQLEEDKTELLSRLSSSSATKTSRSAISMDEKYEVKPRDDSSNGDKEESENSRLLVQQMEEKVKKTMNEIAALDEEKEKLEHLVLQLQGETETIGEYISLYQTQRMLLRQRNKEKDEQLLQLSKDKEELKSKLSTLNDLVSHLLTEKGVECKDVMDATKTEVKDSSEYSEKIQVKIQTLINEIQSTNLINNPSVAFEHCPCCSGRLITI